MDKNIRHIRLLNGDELITVVTGEDEKNIYCENPLFVDAINDEDGNQRAVLTNYIKYSDGMPKCTLNKCHVIIAVKVHPEVERYYNNSLIFTKEYDEEFLNNLKNANENLNEYNSASSKYLVPSHDYEEDDMEFDYLDDPRYFSGSNTSH